MTISITVNGAPAEVPDDTTVADVVATLGHDPSLPGVAAAVDGTVVRRATWTHALLADGVRVEVLTAVQGGAAGGGDRR